MYDFKVIIPGLQLLSTMTSSIMAERSAKCHRPDQSVPEKQAWIVHAGGVAALRAGVSQRVREIQDLICRLKSLPKRAIYFGDNLWTLFGVGGHRILLPITGMPARSRYGQTWDNSIVWPETWGSRLVIGWSLMAFWCVCTVFAHETVGHLHLTSTQKSPGNQSIDPRLDDRNMESSTMDKDIKLMQADSSKSKTAGHPCSSGLYQKKAKLTNFLKIPRNGQEHEYNFHKCPTKSPPNAKQPIWQNMLTPLALRPLYCAMLISWLPQLRWGILYGFSTTTREGC